MAWTRIALVKIHILYQLKKTLHWCSALQDYHKVSSHYRLYPKFHELIVLYEYVSPQYAHLL